MGSTRRWGGGHCAALPRAPGDLSVPRNQVTCLSVSTDGSVLLSGSHDETVRLWDVQSQQCLRTVALKGGRTQPSWRPWARGALSTCGRPGAGARPQGLPRGGWGRECTGVSGPGGWLEGRRAGPDAACPPAPGPVTNACIVLAPVSMLSSDCRPSLPLPHFNKHLLGAEHGDEPRHGGLTLRLGLHQQVRLTPSRDPHPWASASAVWLWVPLGRVLVGTFHMLLC